MQLRKLIRISFIFLLFPMIARAKIVFLSASTRQGEDRYIYVMNDDGSNKTLVYDAKPDMWDTRWTPNGQIAFKSRGKIYLINPDGTNLQQLADPGEGRISYFTFSPDGKKVLFKWEERINQKTVWSVRVLNIETGKIRKIADMLVAFPDWSPDGRYIVYVTPLGLDDGTLGNSLWIMDADGRNRREILSPPVGGALNIARWVPRWSPDSQQIVYTQQNFTWEERKMGILSLIRKALYCVICDKNGNTIRRLNVPKNIQSTSFAWMDGGKSIVFAGWELALNELPPGWGEGLPTKIYKYNLRTNKMVQLTKHPRHNVDVDWISDDVLSVSPEGKMQTQWGAIKEFLQSRSEAFKSLSQKRVIFPTKSTLNVLWYLGMAHGFTNSS